PTPSLPTEHLNLTPSVPTEHLSVRVPGPTEHLPLAPPTGPAGQERHTGRGACRRQVTDASPSAADFRRWARAGVRWGLERAGPGVRWGQGRGRRGVRSGVVARWWARSARPIGPRARASAWNRRSASGEGSAATARSRALRHSRAP